KQKWKPLWWTGLDSNQRTLARADLQSAAFNHSATCPPESRRRGKSRSERPTEGPSGRVRASMTKRRLPVNGAAGRTPSEQERHGPEKRETESARPRRPNARRARIRPRRP